MKNCFIIFTMSLLFSCSSSQEAKKRNFHKQLGTYKLDIRKTNLGNYLVDSDLYAKLIITFDIDSTFEMNMQVPFIFDSIGKWEAGYGLDEWNWIYYKSNNEIKTQFDQCCLQDSTFYLNSTTPKKGFESIKKIYFKKIN